MEAWRGVFNTLKRYSERKKRSRLVWRRATMFYYKMLFRKFAKSIRIEKTSELKSFYFTLWLRNHLEYREKEIRIRELDRVILKKKIFSRWRGALANLNKIQKLTFVLEEISRRVYLSKGLRYLIKEYLVNFTLDRYNEIQRLKLLKKSLDGWRQHMQLDLIKRLKIGRSYEYHYLRILKKNFNDWKKAINIYEEDKNKVAIKKRYFGLWKKVYLFIDSKKNKLSSLYHSLIMLRVYFRGLKERTWTQKRNKIARQFFKCQLFMAWKIVMVKMIYKNQQKKKALNHFKITMKQKYFHRFWTNLKYEKKANKDNQQKLAFLNVRAEKNLRRKYFIALKNYIILNKVSKNRDLHLLYRYFQKLLNFSYKSSILKKRRKELSKLRIARKKYNLFGVLKQGWLIFKKKELIASQYFKNKLYRISFIELMRNKHICQANKMKAADEHFRTATFHKVFYSLNFFKLKQKQIRRVSNNIDWFIEKKIIKVFSKIFTFWKAWAIANQKFRLSNRDLVYRTFYSLKLNCKLKEIN